MRLPQLALGVTLSRDHRHRDRWVLLVGPDRAYSLSANAARILRAFLDGTLTQLVGEIRSEGAPVGDAHRFIAELRARHLLAPSR